MSNLILRRAKTSTGLNIVILYYSGKPETPIVVLDEADVDAINHCMDSKGGL